MYPYAHLQHLKVLKHFAYIIIVTRNINIFHTFELLDRECTGGVGVHCASDGVG